MGRLGTITLATWNINSVRLRAGLVHKLAEEEAPDIVCLQETKVIDELFPAETLREAGFVHVHFSGEKGYNGVAILARVPLKRVWSEAFVNGDKRHIAAELPDGTELHNFYVPAGGDEPDPAINPKFAHKLQFVEEMAAYFTQTAKREKPIIIVGDFNIAPLEQDVWSHKQLLKVVSHTPPETTRLQKLKESLDWVDTSRQFIAPEEKLYSWWSYRNRDWRKSDRGRRLDHIWVTPALAPALKSGYIMKDVRDWEQPSDHVPVVTKLAL